MIRVLKDPLFYYCNKLVFCFCARPLSVNCDDELVIQHTCGNSSHFSQERLEGLSMETVSQKNMNTCQCCFYTQEKEEFYDEYKDYYGF